MTVSFKPPAVSQRIATDASTKPADIDSGVPPRIDLDRPAQLSAIAATEHDRRLAEIAQYFGEGQNHRGLAGAADMIVADAKHGDAGIKTLALQSPCCDRAIERAERHKQARCK